MTVSVTLGPLWHASGRARARGWGNASGRTLVGAALAAYVDADTFAERTAALGGDWAAVWSDGMTAIAAVDAVRSIPLFYGRGAAGCWHLSDDARHVARALGARVDDPVTAAEFLLTGVVTGRETLARGVMQVQAGERVVLDATGTRTERPFLYGAGALQDADDEALAERGAATIEASFEAMLASVRGRPLVVPLSGGMDSRLVAALLARGGRTDATCFTYGEPWRHEARTSRRVARALGLDWHAVRYSPRRWDRWSRRLAYRAFRRDATGLAAIEHEQDWPAIAELMRRGVVAPGSVVVPGHSGDVLGGSHTLSDAAYADPAGGVWHRYFTEWPTRGLSADLASALRDRIETVMAGAATPVEGVGRWGWQERQAKMIVNSVRSYEGHGLDWRLPLWSGRDMLAFWGTVPLAQRRGARLYRRVLRRLMGDALFDIPTEPRRRPAIVGKAARATDFGLGRYGLWLGPHPLARSLRVRVGDLAAVREPAVADAVAQLIGPVATQSAVRISINGLLALAQLNDLATGEPLR